MGFIAHNIMFQGTASTVGKSVITAAFCRIFHQDGYRVAPFKSQNMSLNSYITLDGKEMGRAQAVQAEAAGIEPTVDMNPVLIKPTSDLSAQVIVGGKVHKNMSAAGYDEFKPALMKFVVESYNRLAQSNDIIVIEGAGSPAEINLRQRDIVNMGLALEVDAPVILIGDIDKGGVFASLFGTIMLLDEEERKRVKGVIINKFRGDLSILEPGLKMLEDLIHIPVLGVVPYFDLHIDDEDSVTERFKRYSSYDKDLINIGVVNFQYMSNYTDFAPLENLSGVRLRYFSSPEPGYNPDLVILPGTKNTVYDLRCMRESGLGKWLTDYYNAGGLIMGICGGFQMMGTIIRDPDNVESNQKEFNGLGLINMHTRFLTEKKTSRVTAVVTDMQGTILEPLSNTVVSGYEIHMGVSRPAEMVRNFTRFRPDPEKETYETDGFMSPDGRAFGTYIHGIFDTPDFCNRLLNILRDRRSLKPGSAEVTDYSLVKNSEYDKLADIVRNSVKVDRIYDILLNSYKILE